MNRSVKIKKIIENLPEGFECRRVGGKLCVFKKGWEEEIWGLAEKGIPEEGGANQEIKYLRGRGRPAVVPFERGELVVRHYYHGGIFRGLTRDLFLGLARPMGELRILAEAGRAGIAVPEAAGLIADPVGAGFFRADLITVYIPDSLDLLTYYRQWPPDTSLRPIREKREIIAEAGRLIGALHRSGFVHADLQLKNIMIRMNPAGPRVFILDFDKAGRFDPPREMKAQRNLLRLYRSFRKMYLSHPRVSAYDPLRFLRGYAPNDRMFRRSVIREVRRRRGRDYFHLIKWNLSLRLRGTPYARPCSKRISSSPG